MDLRQAGLAVRRELARDLSRVCGDPRSFVPLPLTIAVSGGVDSASLVVAAMDLGLSPTIATFRMRDRTPYDSRTAVAIARRFGLSFVVVDLPTDENATLGALYGLVSEGFRGKASLECAWPFWFLLQHCGRGTALATGSAADGHYGLSKKAMINFREPKAKFDAWRRDYFGKPDRAQVESVRVLGAKYAVKVVAPYFAASVQRIMRRFGWVELNKPRQKEIVRAAFPELDQFGLRRHQNLQLGDSGIAEHVGRIALKVTGLSSPVAAYNELARRRGAEGKHT